MVRDDAIQAYWSGGPFRVRLLHAPGAFSSEDLAKAIDVLEDFRAECHKAYFAFNGVVNGRHDASEKFQRFMTKREARVSAGSAFPDGEQKPGKSTIAALTQGQLLDSLAKGGDFEDLQNKALVVMLYHRWEEWYRYRIALALALKKNEIRCSLMGEVRLVRNVIVHDNGMVPNGFSAPLLSLIWGSISTGFLVVTDDMVHALMEQLNAIQVEVG